jgi:hypothetical protein
VFRPVEASAFLPDFTFATQGFHSVSLSSGPKTCHTPLALEGRLANPLAGLGALRKRSWQRRAIGGRRPVQMPALERVRGIG